jgi:signal transduction histidine kinase
LLQETELTEKQQESLRMINTSGELLCTVVNDILDYSKLQSGNVVIELRETKLQEILDSVVNSFEHKARSKNIDFKIAYAPSVPDLIETDSNRLQQILYNLLGNAIKFSEPGGSIEFTVEMIIDQDKASPSTSSPERTTKNQEGQMVETGLPYRCPFHRDHSSDTHSLSGDSAHSCESDSLASSRCPFTRSQAPSQTPSGAPAPARLNIGTLRFTVKDFGRGIDAADFERIFEPFGQVGADTSRVYGGTGLGLAITLKLVERLGGKIGVESEVGKWSKFTIDIPLAFRLHPSLGNLIGQLMGTGVTLVEKGDECNQSVFDNLGLAVARFDSCQAMCDWFAQAGRNKALSPQICLIHEDLYIPDEYRRFAETTNATALVTFGPEHKSIPESRLHLRSITDRIPLVLLKSLVALRHHDQDVKLFTARRTPRMDALVDVLVVEDNLINQRVICKMLQRLGIERIDIANNGQEAVDMTATKHYGAIFMDMQMPIMCGDEACRIILDRYQGKARRPKVAFVSADVSSSFVSKATAAGAEHFLSKPFNVKAFERFIRTLQL